MSAIVTRHVATRTCPHDVSERRMRKDGSTRCRACARARDRKRYQRFRDAPATTPSVELAPLADGDARLYTHEEWKAAFPDEWRRITLGARAPGAFRIWEHDDA